MSNNTVLVIALEPVPCVDGTWESIQSALKPALVPPVGWCWVEVDMWPWCSVLPRGSPIADRGGVLIERRAVQM